MKKEIATKWAEALRSGKYKQGQRRLDCDDFVCCLGVLCRMAVEAGVKVAVTTETAYHEDRRRKVVMYDGEACLPPKSVKEWAGMKTREGIITVPRFSAVSLANKNDAGVSFDEIAYLIEENSEIL